MTSPSGRLIPFPKRPPQPEERSETLTALVPDVRRWMWRLLGPRATFDDAVQDALIELANALPSFEGRSSLKTFARTIVVRTAYRHMRPPRDRVDQPEAVENARSHDDPERRAAERQQLDRLHRVLEQLPERQRVAFVLCAVERVPHDEAAALEGISVETLRARLKRAKTELLRRLRADPDLCARLAGAHRDP